MPALIPVVAAWAGSAAAGAFAATAVGSAMVAAIGSTLTGVIVGAVVGAAVGALGAAVMGEDIGKYALYGAVGGAVAGGISGWGAASDASVSGIGETSSVSSSGNLDNLTQMGPKAVDGAGSSASLSTSKGLLSGVDSGDLLQLGGTALEGYYTNKTSEENTDKTIEEADKAREEEFAAQLEQIQANHEARLAEIGAQNGTQLALADKNNAAAMAQLQTRIGADKDTATAANTRQDELTKRLNDSVVGIDQSLFSTPTFEYDPTSDTEFDSGFNDAVAAKSSEDVIDWKNSRGKA